MTNSDIRDLIDIFVDSGVAEMEIKRGENSLRLRRSFGQGTTTEVVIPHLVTQAQQPGPSQQQAPPSQVASGAPTQSIVSSAQPANSDIILKSPIVGTYYDSPKPGDPPFVKVGAVIEVGQVLCIIESMKLMNEIEAEHSGVIAAKLMENGRPVEYGEALFAIRPR
ncbi:MAG: acetyl-CoA carboxylase biotin carboxyl carrier protein [Acidobacteriota bacterium]|nr:acetyl-CoA carboxylase biotin carboxyl carrier protein [Acidobacteriota bacterium]